MPSKRKTRTPSQPKQMLSTGADDPMTPEQAVLLRQLAEEAYELDAFRQRLTRSDAARRIAMLKAKLKLLGEPPHTL